MKGAGEKKPSGKAAKARKASQPAPREMQVGSYRPPSPKERMEMAADDAARQLVPHHPQVKKIHEGMKQSLMQSMSGAMRGGGERKVRSY